MNKYILNILQLGFVMRVSKIDFLDSNIIIEFKNDKFWKFAHSLTNEMFIDKEYMDYAMRDIFIKICSNLSYWHKQYLLENEV